MYGILPIGSMYAIYGNIYIHLPYFTVNIPQMLAYIYIYIPYMDPMGYYMYLQNWVIFRGNANVGKYSTHAAYGNKGFNSCKWQILGIQPSVGNVDVNGYRGRITIWIITTASVEFWMGLAMNQMMSSVLPVKLPQYPVLLVFGSHIYPRNKEQCPKSRHKTTPK